MQLLLVYETKNIRGFRSSDGGDAGGEGAVGCAVFGLHSPEVVL